MKKILCMLLVAAMLLSLSACSKLPDKTDEDSDKAQTSSAASGYDTAEEAFLAYCEGLFTFDWDKITSAIHPDILSSAYGQEFKSYYFATPEYAERDNIIANSFTLRSETFEDRANSIESLIKALSMYCSVSLPVESLKYNKISFASNYDWQSFVFADDQFVFQCEGKWYAFPWFKELDENGGYESSNQETITDNEELEQYYVNVADAEGSRVVIGDSYDSTAVHCFHIPTVKCADEDRFAAVNASIVSELSSCLEK